MKELDFELVAPSLLQHKVITASEYGALSRLPAEEQVGYFSSLFILSLLSLLSLLSYFPCIAISFGVTSFKVGGMLDLLPSKEGSVLRLLQVECAKVFVSTGSRSV